METTLVISAITVIGIIIALILKPSVRLLGHDVGTYWLVALVGAGALLLFGAISPLEAFEGLVRDTSVNPVKLLAIFFGMTVLSVFLDEMNLFEYLASFAVRHSRGTQRSLFFMLYATVSVLTAFTSNDVVILTFTPFILHFARKVNVNPLPFLIGEFVAANTLSMTLIIGNPTNIYLATGAGIDFFEYLKVMIFPSVASSVCAYFVLKLVFRRELALPLERRDEEVALGDRFLLCVGVVHLVGAILTLSVCTYLGIEMWQACVVFVCSLFLITAIYLFLKRESYHLFISVARRLPFALIPFVSSMFVMVLALDKCGFTAEIAGLLGGSHSIWVYGVASFLSANIFNNIPMSVLFSDMISLAPLEGAGLHGALYASVIGSNLGAYLTPVGALAGIMWLSILKRNGQELSFARFVRYGAMVSVPALISALASLALSLML